MMKTRLLVTFIFTIAVLSSKAQEVLPVGNHPPALNFKHFPDKQYAVIWRNWNLVPIERIASTLKTTPAKITAVALAMGLPQPRKILPEFDKRIYITVIRRNWHLLPYHQLLLLLNMTEKELEFALKEDDFLYIKLGSLKPACSEVIFKEPDSQTRKLLLNVKKTASRYFAEIPAEMPFDFVNHLNDVPAEFNLPSQSTDQLRYIYSYFGVFGDPLTDTLHDPYPEGLLARLAEKGVTGVWMHVVLSQLTPATPDFPEFGEGYENRIQNLKSITERAKKYGIAVYLYMNEPRAMPLSFFDNRPEMMGAEQGEFRAMCTSDSTVVNWLSHSLSYLFDAVPHLGGVFTITASENHTHCASHNNQKTCVRCRNRNYADIIADVNRIIANGVHKSNPNAKVIAWDWGWYDHELAEDIIKQLPKTVWFMSVSEWAKEIERGGISSKVGEYSISAVGPGERSKQHWAWAREAGLKTVAKVQFNNTWELSAVPWIPVSYLIAEHANNLAKNGTTGFMLSWSLGGYPSPNLEIAQAFANSPDASIETVLHDIAQKRFGPKATLPALEAWRTMSDAFRTFPYNISTVYTAPMQYGPSNLLFLNSTGYLATMVGFPYDDLTAWRSIYPEEVFINQFKKLANNWESGLAHYNEVIANSSGQQQKNAEEEYRIAKAAWLHFKSVYNQSRFVSYRDAFLKTKTIEIKNSLLQILEEEIETASALLAIQNKDSRIGFEASNQYYYVAQDLVEKILNCIQIKQELLLIPV